MLARPNILPVCAILAVGVLLAAAGERFLPNVDACSPTERVQPEDRLTFDSLDKTEPGDPQVK